MKIICAGCGVLLSGSPDDTTVSHGLCSQECWDRALAAKPKGLGVTVKPRGPREPFKQWYSLMHDVLEEGLTLKEASEKYKVSQQTISNYFKRRPDYKAKYLAAKRKRNPPEGFTVDVREHSTDRNSYVSFDGYVEGKPVGILTLKKTKKSLAVNFIETELGWTRKGVATALYLAAKEWAGARGLTVRSPGRRRNHLSNAAWAKLRKQGLAKRRKNEDYYDYHLPCPKENPPIGLDVVVYEDKSNTTFEARLHGMVVGELIIEPTKMYPEHYEVFNIEVPRKAQRQGIATALYAAARDWVCARGKTLLSRAVERNEKSTGVWASMGEAGVAVPFTTYGEGRIDWEMPCSKERPKENPTFPVSFRVLDRGHGFILNAYGPKGKKIGNLVAVNTLNNYTVINIIVAEEYRKQGIATMLYEKANEEACRRGKPLSSEGYQRSASSNAVWAKLGRMGKAEQDRVDAFGRIDWMMSCEDKGT